MEIKERMKERNIRIEKYLKSIGKIKYNRKDEGCTQLPSSGCW